jgi:hypothetical protein
LRGTGIASSAVANSRVKRLRRVGQSSHLITIMPINLLNSLADWREANSTSPQNTLQLI